MESFICSSGNAPFILIYDTDLGATMCGSQAIEPSWNMAKI